MSHDQYGLQRGDRELKLGSMRDADFIKAEAGKTKQQDSVLPREHKWPRAGCRKLQSQQRKLRHQG